MARPLKKLPKQQIMREIMRLRGRNNRNWAVVWEHGYKTRRGLKAWRKIMQTDALITKWMNRI